MISEVWKAHKFNVEEIVDFLQEHVFPLEPVFQSSAFGGWSVLSSNGSYKDGWHRGFKLYENKSEEERQALQEEMRKAGVKRTNEYTFETEICRGPVKRVIDILTESGLTPARARIIQLAANSESIWHYDSPPTNYQIRFHLPLITNEHCFFETPEERQHLPADGSSYFLYVNRLHRVVNGGDSHRYHLVVDVSDKSGLTQYHSRNYFYEHILNKLGSNGNSI